MTNCAVVNVNGVRAALRKGMTEWLDGAAADVVCLQEVRAPDDIVEEAFAAQWSVVHQASEIKGRAGVAILSRTRALPTSVIGLSARRRRGAEATHTGRWVEATVTIAVGPRASRLRVRPLGQGGHAVKMDDKYAFMDVMTARHGRARPPSTSGW